MRIIFLAVLVLFQLLPFEYSEAGLFGDDDNAETVLVEVESISGSSPEQYFGSKTGILFNYPKNADLKEKKLVNLCAEGAKEKFGSRVKMDSTKCDECLLTSFVFSIEKTRETDRIERDMFGHGASATYVDRFHRTLKIKFYKNLKQTQEVQEIILKSTGSKPLQSVVKSMCVAGFKDFPKDFDRKVIHVKLRSHD